MKIIHVPKPPRSAYDPDRPPGTLLQSQLKHLEWAVRPAGARAGLQVKPAATEAEAAARIADLTRQLVPDAPAAKSKRSASKRQAGRKRTSTRRATKRRPRR